MTCTLAVTGRRRLRGPSRSSARSCRSSKQLVHCRWSGEGCWIPFGEDFLDLGPENATSHPAPGQLIVYPGGISECEILLAYGSVDFSSKVGQLWGNHFVTLTEGLEQLPEVGRRVLWQGAQPDRRSEEDA